MASSMQSAERRWTSTRKSGMTVLGKVPKPINLPSQKLENHGLDPSVEIVPKGTLTWGTRPLLAASSAWGSSTSSSPRGDGNVGSPIHANGRPSSGGSGTRPSTGSSDRSSEPVAIPWGPSSRPSSASGILPSSHMSVAANRPRSAETRPNSSHLSRFAESSADNMGAAGTSERVAAEVSKRSDFTLSSGDFPSLGSEKSDDTKSQKGQNQKVSTPASGPTSSLKGTSESLLTSENGNPGLALHENLDSWNADTHPYAGDGLSTRTDNWRRDNCNTQPLLDVNMPARQYGSWHGPPAQHSNVAWCGGHEHHYRPSFGPPSSYHVDPYYPYMAAGAPPNTQAFPRAEAIPGGVHLKNGEAYRHMPPESYIAHGQSGMPVRPGVYPGPVLYEGCYGPPHTSFDNSSEQDGPTRGMQGQFGVHNQHPPENLRLQPWRFHAQPDGSAPVIAKQQLITGQANEAQGQYMVLLKQHKSQEEKDTVTIGPTAQRGRQPGCSTPEPELKDHSFKQEQATEEQHGKVSHSQHPNDLIDHNYINSSGTSRSATAAGHINDQQNAIVKKNASLMERVEGLNSKTRVVDVHVEGENFPTKEMRSNQNSSSYGHFEEVGPANSRSASNTPSGTRNVDASQLNTYTKVIIHESVLELKPTHPSDELVIVPDKSNYSEDGVHSQFHNLKRVRNIKGKVGHHGKLKFGSYGADDADNTLERDSWEKTIPGSNASQVVPEDRGSHLTLNSVSDRSPLKSDHVQHAKLKELAKQRAVELQKEEEERTAEQKAKALIKLAELNKRASASSKQNSRHGQPLSNDSTNKLDTSYKDEKASAVSETLHGDKNIKLRDPADLSFTLPSGISDLSVQAGVSVGEQSSPLGQESNPEIITARSGLDLQDNNFSRRKQAGYRRRRNIADEQNQYEKLINSEGGGNTRFASTVADDASDGLGILNSDPSVQASKNNRVPKYKNKLSDNQLNSPSPHLTHLEGDSEKLDLEPQPAGENNSNESMRGHDPIDLIAESNQAGPEPTKSTTERPNNNWKPHPHRKPARNFQSDKLNPKYQNSETVVWAPVKVLNKDGSSELHKSSSSEATNLPDGKNVQDMHNFAKSRRAEIERYVPKPIAKELSLQGDSHQSSPPLVAPPSSVKAGKVVTGGDASSTAAKNALNSTNTEDTKQIRHGKTHPSWRQRNSGESPSHEHSVVEGELRRSRPSDDLLVEGGTNLQDEPMTASGFVKDHGVARQRRQQFKEVRVDGSSHAPHSKVLQGDTPDEKETPPAPIDSGERNPSRNENQNAGSGQMKPHWQPKSQVPSQHHYKGSGSAGQRNMVEADDMKYQEGYRETKVLKNDLKNQEGTLKQPSKDHNEPIDCDPTAITANANSYQEFPGAPPRGQNRGHFPRGGAATYGGGKKAHSARNVEQHSDYQTSYNKDGDVFQKNYVASEDASEAHRVSSGSRYGAQGRGHTRRGGHLYGPRRGASVRVNGAYDMGE